jgi:acyl-CoA thioester hydrolase
MRVMSAYEIPITILPEDIDDQNHVNNVVYLRWLQDVAIAHWMARSTPELRSSYGWVAVRHELDYKVAALPGDAITARTWIGNVDSRRFERHSTIVRTNDGTVLCRGRTLWCMINRSTGKVVRIPPEILACFPAAEAEP